MKTINYSFFTSHNWYIDNPECVKPLLSNDYSPFSSLVKESTALRKGVIFQKCPAHTDFTKNVMVWYAPFDLTLIIDIDFATGNGKVFCENINQEIFDQLVDTRFLFGDKSGISPYPVIGIDWLCAFTADTSVVMQVLPAFMHHNDFTSKATLIPGEYDISKWTRPVEIVFEIKKSQERIVIKKGDAIAYIKFITDDQIKLVEHPVPWDEIKICNDLQKEDTYRPLSERYNSLEEVRNKQRCPYEPNNK